MADFVFADSETRSPVPIQSAGAFKYASHPSTEILVWGWVFDGDPAGGVWSPDWCWDGDPEEPTALLDHIEDGGYFVAWNAFFDRHVWNHVMAKKYGWPPLRLEQVLCAQAQAEANNLPGKLEKAAEALNTPYKKDPKGARLIARLCIGEGREGWKKDWQTPDVMGHFRSYCHSDCMAMRDVWNATRPLTVPEWREYHASEVVNDNGVLVDVEFAAAAQQYANAESDDLNARLWELTQDPKVTITNHLGKARWLHNALWPDEELQELVRRPEKDGKERFSADRPTRESLMDALDQPEHADRFPDDQLHKVRTVLELIEAGNSAAVRKFTAMLNQEVDGVVRGHYSFSGAGQTGRFSSRGLQVHNLIRDPLDKKDRNRDMDAIEDIIDGTPVEVLEAEYGHTISRLLARLIRPSFQARPGKTLVWGDWSQIEARVLPWLSNSRGGEAKLDIFRRREDVYLYAAQPIFGLDSPEDATDDQRQVGKVSELALGFGGAVGAFKAMARGYGVFLPEEQIVDIVTAWRSANRWCVSFWDELWNAAIGAFKDPGTWYSAGRVRYLFHPGLMHGTMICALPCGRWIVYPQFRHERKMVEDEKTGKAKWRWQTSFVKGFGGGYGRVDLWYGMLAENITQATAASFLRGALTEMCDWVVLHTHDEIVCEADESEGDFVAAELEDAMLFLPDWAEGMPLDVDMDRGPFYSKGKVRKP